VQGEVRPTENGSLHRRLADGGGDVTEGHLKCLQLSHSTGLRAFHAESAETKGERGEFSFFKNQISARSPFLSALRVKRL